MAPILGAVAVVGVGIVPITAIWVCCVAIGLNLGCAWARESRRTGIKLEYIVSVLFNQRARAWQITHPTSCTRSDVVGKAGNVLWVAHKDGCFDLSNSSAAKQNSGIRVALVRVAAATECCIEYLTPLYIVRNDDCRVG